MTPKIKFLSCFLIILLLFPFQSFSKKLPPNCKNSCVTPYGTLLGESPSGVKAYSNCKSECVIFTPHHFKGVYTGIRWQCVEYARRWLIQNKNMTYGSVDFASDIWKQIQYYENVKTHKKVKLFTQPNGSPSPPQKGDLIIYSKEFKGTGHVAVISKVSLQDSKVYVVEENYFNKKWTSNFARTLPLIQHKGLYWILDPYLLGWKHLARK